MKKGIDDAKVHVGLLYALDSKPPTKRFLGFSGQDTEGVILGIKNYFSLLWNYYEISCSLVSKLCSRNY